ncbi:MAG: hypothetical protein RBT49_02570 [Bacteroidales bacterium]|jgi:hypothetical protein|nr:hypothetical protein [Bacteroidales bacterium]
MGSIHYFQRYSQPENVATNNTLLLFSRFYHYSPEKFKGFINDLLNDYDFEVGIQFNQQQKNESSVPDGSISQTSFKIVIETKLHKFFQLEQLLEHLKSFGAEKNQVLLSLSPNEPNASFKEKLFTEVENFNNKNKTKIKYIATTFEAIVDKFNNSIEYNDYELLEIINDYEQYCLQSKLIIDFRSKMRVVTCGWTLDENLKYDLYYAPADRSYSDHNYIGIYSKKEVVAIGKIENIIKADLIKETQELNIIEKISEITVKQRNNIVNVISEAFINNKWDITNGHRFFCVEKFYLTKFKKTTKYPLQGTKLFDLKKVLNVDTLPDTKEIAHQLEKYTWPEYRLNEP